MSNMLAVPVFDTSGKRTGEMEVDPALLGGHVRPQLLKQAIVAYMDHQRQDSARTKGRADVTGSTRKLYRQKGTGNARAGARRTPVRRGGGRTFSKRGPGSRVVFPKKMRRLARNSAILAKIESNDALVVDGLAFDAPKTKLMAGTLASLGVDRGCMLAFHDSDRNVYLSTRNLPDTDMRPLEELTAYEVLRRRKLLFSRQAFERLLEQVASNGAKNKK